MNITAIKTAFLSLSFRARVYGAMRKAMLKGHNTYVCNRNGQNVLRVDYTAGDISAFRFTDTKFKDVTTNVLKNLREVY